MNGKSSFTQIKILRGELAQGALLSLFWQGIRIFFLALWIILFARYIGAEGYGIFAGIAGIATTMGSFLGMGAGLVMIQDTNRTPSLFSTLWGKTLSLCLISGAVLFVVFIICSKAFLLHQSIFLIVSIGISELLLFPLATNSAYAFAANNKVGWAASLQGIMAASRLLALLIFLYLEDNRNLITYMWYHLASTLLASLLCLKLVSIKLTPVKVKYKLDKHSIFGGFYFCTTLASSSALTSLDKPIVLTLAGPEIAGIYSAICRCVYILIQPIDALIIAAMPKLFRQHSIKENNSNTIKYLFICIIVYGIIAGLLLLLAPDLIVFILGHQFHQAASVLGWCAFLIPCYGIRILITNIFMTSDKVKWKIAIELTGLLTLLALGYFLIGSYGLKGAIFTLLGTELFLALFSCLIFFYINHRFAIKQSCP